MTQFKKDMLSALVFLVIGIAVLVSTPATIVQTELMFGVGPRTFPYFIGGCMTVLSVCLGASALIRQHKLVKADQAEQPVKKTEDQKKTDRVDELRALGTAAVCILYAWAFDKVSFFISTFILMTALLAIFKVKKPLSYIICYASGIVIWACFTYLFSVRLP